MLHPVEVLEGREGLMPERYEGVAPWEARGSRGIEVGFEALDVDVIGGALKMDGRHQVFECDWVRAVRRWTENPELFVYRHQETGNFVLAEWRSRVSRVCQELEVLGPVPPDRGSWLPRIMIERRCRPATEIHQEMARRASERKARKRRLRESSREERSETARWLKKQGMDASAAAVAQGAYTGQEEGGERLEEMQEELMRAASGRVITHG